MTFSVINLETCDSTSGITNISCMARIVQRNQPSDDYFHAMRFYLIFFIETVKIKSALGGISGAAPRLPYPNVAGTSSLR